MKICGNTFLLSVFNQKDFILFSSLETAKPHPPPSEDESTGKFRRLQMKWEMLSGRDSNTAAQSEEPSPTASPVKTR